MATIYRETIDFKQSAQDDLEVIRRLAEGDLPALEVLYKKYSASLYTFLVHMVMDEHVAEDLIQEAFLAVWAGAGRFRGQAAVKTWLFQIAHNQAVTWLRRNHARPVAELLDDPGSLESPEDTYISSWLSEQVRAAVNELSAEHRAVIELAYFHDLSHAEIAAVMRCPTGTVKSRMSYARRYLEDTLKRRGLDRHIGKLFEDRERDEKPANSKNG